VVRKDLGTRPARGKVNSKKQTKTKHSQCNREKLWWSDTVAAHRHHHKRTKKKGKKKLSGVVSFFLSFTKYRRTALLPGQLLNKVYLHLLLLPVCLLLLLALPVTTALVSLSWGRE